MSSQHASWIAYLQQSTFVIKHTFSVSNRVANALNRCRSLLAVLHTSVPGFSNLYDLYPSDPYFGKMYEAVSQGVAPSDYTMHDGFLFHGTISCIPDCSFRLQILSELHKEGNVGRDRTLQLVSSS